VWRARIVLLTADGLGTNEIMRQTAKSKTCLWRWQEELQKLDAEQEQIDVIEKGINSFTRKYRPLQGTTPRE
jgi:hypothetical protein